MRDGLVPRDGWGPQEEALARLEEHERLGRARQYQPEGRTTSGSGAARCGATTSSGRPGPSTAAHADPSFDDIEEVISDDGAFSHPPVRPDSHVSRREQQHVPLSEAEARFPHFSSIAAIRRDGTPSSIDYLGQFSAAAASAGAAPKGARSKEERKQRKAPPRNSWRTSGGQKVYTDESGKQHTGHAAYRKYSKAKQAQ